MIQRWPDSLYLLGWKLTKLKSYVLEGCCQVGTYEPRTGYDKMVHSTTMVLPRYEHGMTTGTNMVRTWYGHGAAMIRPWYTCETITVRFSHGIHVNYCIWSETFSTAFVHHQCYGEALRVHEPIQNKSLPHFWYQGSIEDFRDLCRNRPAFCLKHMVCTGMCLGTPKGGQAPPHLETRHLGED